MSTSAVYARVAERLGDDVTDKWWDHDKVAKLMIERMDFEPIHRIARVVGDAIWKMEMSEEIDNDNDN